MQPKEYDCKYAYAVKFHERVSRHLLGETIPLKAEVFHSVEPVPFQLAAAGKYRPISEGESWGGAWESGWFRLHAEIPADWTGRQLALRLNLGGEALLFDRDGVPQFAFSAGSLLGPDFRKEIYRLPDCPAGRQAEFLVEAAGNVVHGLLPDSDPELGEQNPYGRFRAVAATMRIGCFNHELWQLSLDLEILLDLLKGRGSDIKEQHMDCGIEIFDRESQDTHSGGSGCGCSAVTLAALILPKLTSGEWKRVLFVPTGALLSTVSYNEGQSVPGIAHGVVLEHC